MTVQDAKCICDGQCPMTEDRHWINCPAHKYHAGYLALITGGERAQRKRLAAVLQPFAKLANDFAAVCTQQVGGRGIYGLIPETPLPVGGELAQKTCTISIGDLIAIRDAFNTLQTPTPNNDTVQGRGE